MGNGPTPVGVNEAEIRYLGEAGLSGDALRSALTGAGSSPQLLHNSLPLPHSAAEHAVWYSTAQRLNPDATEVFRS